MAAGCVWGIDLGKSSLKAIRVREGKDEVEILAIIHLEYDIDEDGTIGKGEASAALDELVRRHPEVKKESVWVSLPGHASFSRFIKLPAFDTSRIDEMISFEAQQQIPFAIDEVVWDYAPIDEDEEEISDEGREVGIFAIKKEVVDEFLTDLKLSGIEPDGVTVAPLANYNFVRFDFDYDEGKACVVLDIGWDHSDLVVIDGERYWLRNLALSGSELTKAIATKTRKNFDEAEDLKREAGKADEREAKKIYSATQLVLRDFVSEIHRSIGFYKAQNKGRKVTIGEIVLLGSGSKLPAIRPFLQKELRYPVSTAKRLSEITLDEDLGEDEVELLQENLPGLSVAMGLGIQGAGYGFNEINLLPEEIKLEKQLNKKKLPVLIAVVALFAVVGLFYMQGNSQLAETDKVVKTAKREVKPLDGSASRVQTLRETGAKERELESLVGYLKGRNHSLTLLNKIAQVLPQANGRLPELTKEQNLALAQGHKRQEVDKAIREINQAMSGLNQERMFLLGIDLETIGIVRGKAESGARVEREGNREVPVDGSGRFEVITEGGSTKPVTITFVFEDGERVENPYVPAQGVRAILTVAKLFVESPEVTLSAIEKQVLEPLKAQVSSAALEGIPTTIYALDPEASTPPVQAGGGFGQTGPAAQKYLMQKIVV
ncbi:MAG: type IV pilus assembly protein PilM, partial [Planctomycetota bacterium]